MKIALAVWNNRISPVLDVARQFLILDVDHGAVWGKREEVLPHLDSAQRLARLAELDVRLLVCGAVSRPVAAAAEAYGLRIMAFVAGEVDRVIAAYLEGLLPNQDFLMPGCRTGRRRLRVMGGEDANFLKTEQDASNRCRRAITMPRGDGTGPPGKGRQAGGGSGACGKRSQSGAGRTGRAGSGQGMGRGRGQGNSRGRKIRPDR
ncbi:MAG: hypothetical protein JSW39_04125 [Desulfobacterales bacterium]|nr:MAG: hypothetical protein JSW39_04125 [Desulfobacterales bacterium]